MRKRIVGVDTGYAPAASRSEESWLDLDQIASVEVTSEDPNFPIESAFSLDGGPGWRASAPGDQQIRIIFDEPVHLRRIRLHFEEAGSERTQEFVLRWSSTVKGPMNDIVRQQWNFSPAGSTTEIEDFNVDLSGVSLLELAIKPDIAGRNAVATLQSMRLG
jgi:hypothetical protein